jgi:acyl-coenzyme A synthetase/AMP-(fatty) acid ligase
MFKTEIFLRVISTGELDHVANIIQPNLWICSGDFLPSLDALAKMEGYKHSTKAVVVDGKEKPADWNSNWTLAGRPAFVRPQINVYEDIATLPFSSGTTGLDFVKIFLVLKQSIKINKF